MAIRRCPYCKAIIDEGSEYCSNCGTQLLFPEDEYINEEIPGEKVVDEEAPEEETLPKKKSSSRKRKKKEEEQELEPVVAEEEANLEKPEDTEKDVEVESEEEGIRGDRDVYFVEKQDPAFKTEDLEKFLDPEEKEKVEIEKFLKSLKEDRDEWDGEIPPTDELPPWAEKIKDEKPEESPVAEAGVEPEQEVVAEVESELEPEEKVEPVEEAVVEPEAEVVAEAEAEQEEVVEAEVEPEEEIVMDEEASVDEAPKEDTPPFIDDEETEEKEEVLRPMGLTPEDEVPEVKIPDEETEQEEAVEEEKVEEELAEEAPEDEEAVMPDTGMGLPEGVEQESLPFADKSSMELEDKKESPPSRLSYWLKSRAFDVLFIAALWFVTLHIASRMLSTNLFKLISVAVLPVFGFYLTLLAVYLFLFFVFLGQTLGDQLFPYEE